MIKQAKEGAFHWFTRITIEVEAIRIINIPLGLNMSKLIRWKNVALEKIYK